MTRVPAHCARDNWTATMHHSRFHSARHVATELTRPKSGGLRHLVWHSSCLQQCKNYFYNRRRFSEVTIRNVLPPFYGSLCIIMISNVTTALVKFLTEFTTQTKICIQSKSLCSKHD